MTDLISALESAEAPSRELDARICDALGLGRGDGRTKRFTSSIDAALTLVPEGWEVFHCTGPGYDASEVWEWCLRGHGPMRSGLHKHPAIALTIASLRAREAG